ncbi:hypothetical protein [Segetibacter aerophilus]|uniref:hypothetical protein n=1 Tax=Segetibacter aerophilus TaxID=670293 RepID=UPI0011BD64E3|nr:hypothetical protein [Segetibacter aerophilus]
MTTKTSQTKHFTILLPTFGVLVFSILYIVSTLLYPGGYQENKQSKGFSWLHNYWCNLLDENAINGAVNSARPYAMTAMFILCATLAVFWFLFARRINFSKSIRRLITFSGIASMTITMFLFTSFHDAVINVAGGFGLIALAGTYAGLYKKRSYPLFVMGLFNLLLIIVNNILYYSAGLLKYLPVVQKITFLFFLTWICLIDIFVLKKLHIAKKAEQMPVEILYK